MSRIGQARDHYWARGIWYEGNMTEVLRLQASEGRPAGTRGEGATHSCDSSETHSWCREVQRVLAGGDLRCPGCR